VHDVVDRLFVYGTLRSGEPMRSLIADHVVRSEPARSTGVLYGFDEYPGLIDEGSAPVVGELVWLTELAAAFALLDAYEGKDFIRVLKQIRCADGEEQWAWCYVLAERRTAEAGTVIPSGEWRQARK
jgi:gamma-glutamylcyclotransferase (GGCT)/AIG2-like uncharacterized protein YtfP